MAIYYTYIFVLFLLSKVFNTSCSNQSNLIIERNEKKSDDISIIGKSSKIFVILSSFFLFIILAFRDISVGTDTYSYYIEFNSFSTYVFPQTIIDFIRGEYGYKLIVSVFNGIGASWLFFQIVYAAFVSISTGHYIYYYSENEFTSFILFITVGTFPMSLTGIRQTLALSILLISYIAIEKKKLFRAIALVLVASTIHYTAIIGITYFIPFIFINGKKVNKKGWLFVYIMIPIVTRFLTDKILLLFSDLLLDKYSYSGYFSTLNQTINPIVLLMYWTLFIFCFISLIFGKINYTKRDLIFFVFSALFIATYEAGKTVYMLTRLSYYYSFFFIVMITNSIYRFPMSERSRKIISFVICLFCVIAFVISIPGNSYGIDSYVFWRNYR